MFMDVHGCFAFAKVLPLSPQLPEKHQKTLQLSKLVPCLNGDGCFEGVPSLATVLASFEAWGIATRHWHAFAK